MNKEKAEEIKKHLSKYGWKFNFSEPNNFETGWSTQKERFKMVISTSNSFASFTVSIASLHNISKTQRLPNSNLI